MPPCLRVLVAPLPQKSHTASRVAIFGDPVNGAHILFYGRKFTLFPKAASIRLLGGALAKTSFCLRELFVLVFAQNLSKEMRAFA